MSLKDLIISKVSLVFINQTTIIETITRHQKQIVDNKRGYKRILCLLNCYFRLLRLPLQKNSICYFYEQ